MAKVPFKVSAKAARLIGRENVANAEGALTELVKNSYDADAQHCVLAFVPHFSGVPDKLSLNEYEWFKKEFPAINDFYSAEDLNKFSKDYKNYSGSFLLNENQYEANPSQLEEALTNCLDLWIIDDGTGMTAKTIEEHWMVIGTNFKEQNIWSDKGRVRTGAKGIGRFALDRLGQKCALHSTSNPKDSPLQSVSWEVNWNEFEGTGKVLDDIEATLNKTDEAILDLIGTFSDYPELFKVLQDTEVETGTGIKIELLRDTWSIEKVSKLHRLLEALIPPVVQKPLKIALFDHRVPFSELGFVSSELSYNYDYRLDAKVKEDSSVELSLYRAELEVESLHPDLFKLEDMKNDRFNRKSFSNKKLVYTKTFKDFFPSKDAANIVESLKKVGPFEFNLLFFKQRLPGSEELKRYPYRNFDPSIRKSWLQKNAGIKIFRDGFAVRPYGEMGSKSFDWLSLGQRVAANPAQASRKGWSANPQQLAGTITISRIANANLNDQANREGIIENEAFSALKLLLLKIIAEFENDRSYILSNLKKLYELQNPIEQAVSEGSKTAQKVIKDPSKASQTDAEALAKGFTAQEERISELLDEQSMLRSLATLGTVLVSFSHEMGQLRNAMGSRSSDLSRVLKRFIDDHQLEGVNKALNPFHILENWKADDLKVKQWFTFALANVMADKRRRKTIKLSSHLKKNIKNWKGFLKPREIDLSVKFEEGFDPSLLAYGIDLDSIFNNLIINSIEAMLSSRHHGDRKIDLEIKPSRDNNLLIIYKDSGPGLDKAIKNPRDIFNFAVTTKLDASGLETGTGLGMWILSSIISSYKGSFNLITGDDFGFGIHITLPMKE